MSDLRQLQDMRRQKKLNMLGYGLMIAIFLAGFLLGALIF